MSEETFGSYGSPLHVTLITIVLVTTIGLLIVLITPTLRSCCHTVSGSLKSTFQKHFSSDLKTVNSGSAGDMKSPPQRDQAQPLVQPLLSVSGV